MFPINLMTAVRSFMIPALFCLTAISGGCDAATEGKNVTTELGAHTVTFISGHASVLTEPVLEKEGGTAFFHLKDGLSGEECLHTVEATIENHKLSVDGKPYGTLKPEDVVTIEVLPFKVSVNSTEAQVLASAEGLQN